MSIKWPDDPSIGNIEADLFDPATWKTEYPNPAFKQMDAADAFWAASIMSRFTNAMIRGVVEEARLTNPESARQLADVIIKRRDKSVRWGITATNPLHRFEIRGGMRPSWRSTTPRSELDSESPVAGPRSAGRRSTTPPDCRRNRATIETSERRGPVPHGSWGPRTGPGSVTLSPVSRRASRSFRTGENQCQVTIRNRNGHFDVVGVDRPT